MNDQIAGELSLAGTASPSEPMTPEETLDASRVTPKTSLSPMEHLFLMYGKPCFYRGELTADCGKAKSGKTNFLSILMACTMREQPESDDGKERLAKILALERVSANPIRV